MICVDRRYLFLQSQVLLLDGSRSSGALNTHRPEAGRRPIPEMYANRFICIHSRAIVCAIHIWCKRACALYTNASLWHGACNYRPSASEANRRCSFTRDYQHVCLTRQRLSAVFTFLCVHYCQNTGRRANQFLFDVGVCLPFICFLGVGVCFA